jgi:TRAP-type C4-dicarboxylate transport system permease small subunit
MLITGIILTLLGILMFYVGWKLNTETPFQQPLPVVGVGFGFVGLALILLHF